jgi:hypothetical protein
MPSYGKQTAAAGKALWRACADMDSVFVAQQLGSLLAQNCNALWCWALNMVRDGERVDYFAMLHDDIGASDFWLDRLIDELEANDLDLLGVVAPIKDSRGLTSTALAGDDPWAPHCRLSMHEVYQLPETFTEKDVGRPLCSIPAAGFAASIRLGSSAFGLRSTTGSFSTKAAGAIEPKHGPKIGFSPRRLTS